MIREGNMVYFLVIHTKTQWKDTVVYRTCHILKKKSRLPFLVFMWWVQRTWLSSHSVFPRKAWVVPRQPVSVPCLHFSSGFGHHALINFSRLTGLLEKLLFPFFSDGVTLSLYQSTSIKEDTFQAW